ncbi:MAG: heterodisulfide reductase-related iron-sulfur binding cluster, partial [Chloroflexota bacterium]
PLTARLFGNIHRVNKLGSLVPVLTNFMLTSPFGLTFAKAFGLPTERPLPTLAKSRFSQTINRPSVASATATLIIDTFTEYNHPEIGQAVLDIANKIGVELNVLRLPKQGCCGRPALSKGLLDQAKQMATDNVRYIRDHVPDGALLFLEPSCQSAFLDDYTTLVNPDLQDAAKSIAARSASVERWLHGQLHDKSLAWDTTPANVMLHGHCHQKALWQTDDTLLLLRLMPDSEVSEIDSGCCGVAGSFGYEHYATSMDIGNQRLLPAIEAAPDATVVAPGTSCRAQITDAGHAVLHPVELINNTLKGLH